MNKQPKLLVVDDDQNLRKTLSDILRVKGYNIIAAGSGAEAVTALEGEQFSLAIIDLKLPDMSGLDLLERLKALSPLTEAIILTGNATLDTAIEATRRGAFCYILKPYQIDDLLMSIRHGVDRKQAQMKIRRLSEALRQSHEAIFVADEHFHFEYVNPAFSVLFGYMDEELLGKAFSLLESADDAALRKLSVVESVAATGEYAGEVMCRDQDGHLLPILLNVAPIRYEHEHISNFVGTMTDLSSIRQMEESLQAYVVELTQANTELKALNAKLERTQLQLIQSEKMASLGVLAAGVAHEINNPLGFIKCNIGVLGQYVEDFLLVLGAYKNAEALLQERKDAFAALYRLEAQTRLEDEIGDVRSLLSETHHGLERIKKIVLALKDFAHMEATAEWLWEDIHKGLESTLNIVWNELKYTCEVRKEYGQLPPIECVLSQLNQVFMNLLVNAAHAIESKGIITIRTGAADDQIWVEISDTGKGIAPENIKSIFDPFFTTKPVGKGTGLGLSISYDIIRKHYGRIDVESELGKGSTFRIWLPVKQPAENAEP